MNGVNGSEGDEYARFEDLARKVANTPKAKPSGTDRTAPLEPAGEPAKQRAEREEDDGDGD